MQSRQVGRRSRLAGGEIPNWWVLCRRRMGRGGDDLRRFRRGLMRGWLSCKRRMGREEMTSGRFVGGCCAGGSRAGAGWGGEETVCSRRFRRVGLLLRGILLFPLGCAILGGKGEVALILSFDSPGGGLLKGIAGCYCRRRGGFRRAASVDGKGEVAPVPVCIAPRVYRWRRREEEKRRGRKGLLLPAA